MVVVLEGEATYAGRPLPRAAVHLYSPDTPLGDIEATGATRVMLLVVDQEMRPQDVVAYDPPAAYRSELLDAGSRPTEQHKLLQYVTVTLDSEGNCNLSPRAQRCTRLRSTSPRRGHASGRLGQAPFSTS